MPRSKLLFLSLICSSVFACGGRSGLDEYEHGLASVVPRTNAEGRPDGQDGQDGDGDTQGDGAGPGDGDGDGDKPGSGDGDEPGDDGALLPIGSACSDSDECGSEDSYQCLKQLSVFSFFSVAFPGGMCTSACSADKDCPDGSGCFKDLGTPGCMPLCDTVSDCRGSEKYTCGSIPQPISQDTRTFCLPPFSIPGLPF